MTVLDGTIPNYWVAAECNTGDGSLVATFYPKPSPKAYAKAGAICARCPVVDECLAQTMATERTLRGRHGFAGGLTPEQRDQLARSGAA